VTSKIFIASKDLTFPISLSDKQHLYLVFDADGDPSTTVDQQILRAGPESALTMGQITIEPGLDFSGSSDKFDSGDYTDRNYTELTTVDPDGTWAEMLDKAAVLAGPEDENHRIHTTIDYSPLGPNSNSFVATILAETGFDIVGDTPLVGGAGDAIPLGTFTGWNGLLGTSGNDNWTVDISQPASRIVFDQGGDDNYTLDASTFATAKGLLTIEEVAQSGSDDVLTLENIAAEDVGLYRTPDGKGLMVVVDDKVVGWVPEQFNSAYPLLNHVHVIPPVGSPTDIPVTDPDSLPFYHDMPLPAPLGEVQPAFAEAITSASPLVIDLSSGHTGVTLTTWSASSTHTYFDLNDNGFAVQTAWVSGDTGLLARDLNSNGVIDSSAELFGSPTIDGFAKLAVLDSNHDLRIDNNDDAWSSLVVWTDTNGDAATQSGELHSLPSLNIASIDLAALAASTSSISGNPISHVSKVTFTSGATAAIDDAWFVHDNTNTYYSGDYTLDAQTAFLPGLRGYGLLPNLNIAMSQDSDLKDMVADFAASFTFSSFADAKSQIEDIIFKWAGLDGVDPESRGPNMDARHIGLIEQLVGADFYHVWQLTSDPNPGAAVDLDPVYKDVFNMLAADLLVQTSANALFDSAVTYNQFSGEIEGVSGLSQTAIADLVSAAPSPGSENDAFWQMIATFIDTTKGLDNLSGSEISWLNDAMYATDPALSLNTVHNMIDPYYPVYTYVDGTSGNDTLSGGSDKDIITGYDGNDTIHGNGGNDTINGNAGANVLYGDAGNDTIYGGIGNDSLYGGDGDDTLSASIGNNLLNGGLGANTISAGDGNDTYIYEGGQDLLNDSGGTDTIYMPTGVVAGDLTFSRVSTNGSHSDFSDLLIHVDGYDSIQIQNPFSSPSYAIETIVFSNSTTLSLSTITSPDVYLTDQLDSFSTSNSGNFSVFGLGGDDYIALSGSGTHTIDGGGGNDAIQGGSGNDTYVASPGFDTITDVGGTDTIVIPAEFDASDVTVYRINNASGPTNDLGISIAGYGEIDVSGQFNSVYYGVENLHFLSDNSTVSLTGMSITTLGTAGNDSIYAPYVGAGANDIIDGREGNDYLAGGSGNDTYIFSAGHDTIYDDGGNDTLLVRPIYAPGDVTIAWNYDASNYANGLGIILTDSDGNTVVVQNESYSTSYGIEHVAFDNGTTWDLNSLELNTYGTSGADGLNGHDVGDASSADTIYGYAGTDTINGGNGNDLIYGGDDNDYLLGNAGNDTINGGNGNDIIYASSGDGTDTVHGDAGADTIYGVADSVLSGDDGNDTLYNNASYADGGSTAVTLHGGDGADTLYGGYGTTALHGDAGADTLVGMLYGVDVFTFDAASAFNAVDTIQSFNTGDGDKIDVSNILETHYDPLHDLITNFVQIQTNGSNSELFVDTTGTATFNSADHVATILSVTGLTDEAALVTAGTLIAA
jgi:Ca2+-binding RTX toxin-like protein